MTVALDKNKNRRKEEQAVMWEDVFARVDKSISFDHVKFIN